MVIYFNHKAAELIVSFAIFGNQFKNISDMLRKSSTAKLLKYFQCIIHLMYQFGCFGFRKSTFAKSLVTLYSVQTLFGRKHKSSFKVSRKFY